MKAFPTKFALACAGGLPALPALAAEGALPADTGATAWVLTASALVLFMTLPGLALFYGGLVRSRNVLSVLMHCFAICCIVSVLWIAIGYTLAFGEGRFIGSAAKAFLAHPDERRAGTGIPENVFALFQMTFAIITPALIIGAFPERARFPFVLAFSALWLLLVYVPVAHWVWGGGWLANLGVLDFAGGIVVHTTAGISALVLAIVIGARRGFPANLVPPHSPGMTMAGAAMLWVGWFGFNGGSALTADAAAGSAVIATHLAASAGALTWMGIEWAKVGKPTCIGLVTGCVAGLATITPASGYVAPAAAMALGAAGGALCFAATLFVKTRLRIDDSLDVFAVHGVGGVLGSLLLAVLAVPGLGGTNPNAGATWTHQFLIQALAVAVAVLWSAVLSYAIVRIIGLFARPRVTDQQEHEGLDLTAHGERAYDYT